MKLEDVVWEPVLGGEEWAPLAYMWKGTADGRALAWLRDRVLDPYDQRFTVVHVPPDLYPIPAAEHGLPGDLFN